MRERTGRVTIPTNLDIVPETIELMKRWGADAIRDCDGTEFPKELVETGAKIYATYYTTRKDNEWAKKNPDEVQQCYIMSAFYTAVDKTLKIPLMKGISKELMEVNTRDDIRRWWSSFSWIWTPSSSICTCWDSLGCWALLPRSMMSAPETAPCSPTSLAQQQRPSPCSCW